MPIVGDKVRLSGVPHLEAVEGEVVEIENNDPGAFQTYNVRVPSYGLIRGVKEHQLTRLPIASVGPAGHPDVKTALDFFRFGAEAKPGDRLTVKVGDEEHQGMIDPDAPIHLWPGEPDSEGKANGLTPFGTQVVSNLRSAADTFEERAAVYRDNYERVGEVMQGLFPHGMPDIHDPQGYNRWHLFELAIVKLTRYAVNYDQGHDDSLSDMIVYLAMVQGLDRQEGRG